MRNLTMMLFSFGGGLSTSGIVASLYRILAHEPQSRAARMLHYAVMTLAGPSVLLENSTRSFRAKTCSGTAYGFAIAVAGYWAVLIGAVVIDLAF
jgi:hypothetical protein